MSTLPESIAVIERHHVQFNLPASHSIAVDREHRLASLSTGDRGGTYELLGEQNTDGFLVYRLGAEQASHSVGHIQSGYPFPTVDEALERYKREHEALGGQRVDIEAWAEGSGHLNQFQKIRSEVSRLRGETAEGP